MCIRDRSYLAPMHSTEESTADRRLGVRSVHYRIVGSIVAGALFMESLDATVLATAIPAMAADFRVRPPETVSYTHLDVYKRQDQLQPRGDRRRACQSALELRRPVSGALCRCMDPI